MPQDLSSFIIKKPLWQQVKHSILVKNQTELWLCSLPTEPKQLAGNKWLKLKYHLARVFYENKQGIVTFGGPFSNHIAAVAAACSQLNLTSLTYLRADRVDYDNPTIKLCLQHGMQFKLLNRADYRLRNNMAFCQNIVDAHPNLLLVPEGGSSVDGVKGVAELNLTATPNGDADLISLATASGGTLAGTIKANKSNILGIAVVKDPTLPNRVAQLLPTQYNALSWSINTEFTEGGYAKFSPELLSFCQNMAASSINVEPIYTGKALFGLFKLIEQGQLAQYKRISFFHTGGLQGLDGLMYRSLISPADHKLLAGN
ncbi:1-aminocyclopropane-1-carboxylate deaminase/D-cysteine desulfhydrase [Rheinheimera sp. MMS21-TC3]|uniref:1-aminocyclopropane-1-carboxylate deaminase/D-cysteine desulfhydrase n=1 Tax=Rheinheimera sp. MMS21-TC3 TaxID=3072790 RepID=UPI0028C49B6D|nr:pyridoxal-phosphate dependent enzyme [Rheinheimera sp. MMS21-TC3]WNO59907.1 pyridoxal-phosphate dependent enzyme [Rheinheimera sp. MMS21-TC3]